MRFLLDENLPRAAANLLRDLGHDVLFVAETDPRGQPDDRLTEICNDQGRILVSFDLGIANLAAELRTGLVLVRAPGSFNQQLICDLLRAAISEDLEGSITVVSPGRIRVRRLPPRSP